MLVLHLHCMQIDIPHLQWSHNSQTNPNSASIHARAATGFSGKLFDIYVLHHAYNPDDFSHLKAVQSQQALVLSFQSNSCIYPITRKTRAVTPLI